LLGVQGQRDGIAFAAIEHGGNLACLTQAASLVLAPIGAGRSFYYDLRLGHTFIPSLESCGTKNPDLAAAFSFQNKQSDFLSQKNQGHRQKCLSHSKSK
jgi:hypothetical protein